MSPEGDNVNPKLGADRLPLVEERVTVKTEERVTETVRIRVVNDTAEQLVRQELNGEALSVERVPMDLLIEPGAAPPQIRKEGNVTIIPVLEEVLVIEKR